MTFTVEVNDEIAARALAAGFTEADLSAAVVATITAIAEEGVDGKVLFRPITGNSEVDDLVIRPVVAQVILELYRLREERAGELTV